jgi:hypothetical protein
MAVVKLMLETLRMADGGRVVCDVATPEGELVKAMIEHSFFEDFMGSPQPNLTVQKQDRIVRDNVGYLEAEVERQLQLGSRELVIR